MMMGAVRGSDEACYMRSLYLDVPFSLSFRTRPKYFQTDGWERKREVSE